MRGIDRDAVGATQIERKERRERDRGRGDRVAAADWRNDVERRVFADRDREERLPLVGSQARVAQIREVPGSEASHFDKRRPARLRRLKGDARSESGGTCSLTAASPAQHEK